MILRCVDVETCGLEEGDLQIVEAATLDLQNRGDGGWERGQAWEGVFHPGREIPCTASAVHHITDAMVAMAPAWPAGGLLPWDVPLGMLKPDAYVAHNSRFEDKVLRVAGVVLGPWIDTYRCALVLWPEAPSHGNQALRYWLGLKFAGEAPQLHRAAGDACVTAALLRRMLSVARVEQLLEISTRPALLPCFRFGKHANVALEKVPLDYLEWITDKSDFKDEDVLYTAAHWSREKRRAQKQRSPV